MYRLFITIFLWFWVTAWGMLAIVFLVNDLKGVRQVTAPSMYATIAPILAAEAAKTYESGGPEAFARFALSNVEHERQLFLLDGFYRDVLRGQLTDDGLEVAREAKYGQLLMLHNNIAAYRFVSSTGRPYILLLYLRKSVHREIVEALVGRNLPYTICLVLLVTVLCFALAYHIAAPIHSIQSTARRVAQGDLKARVSVNVSRRFDELSALAKDFDSMVGRLELLIQTQKSLLSSVSHELRSPLARINLAVALLKKRYAADADDMFQHLDRDVARVDLLIGQLLTLSRLEAGLSSAEREDVDLNRLVEWTATDCNFEADALGKSVSFRATGGEFILGNADPHALRSACENVIRNAVRFTRPGTNVEVVLEIDRNTPETLGVLSIRDHGPGVPEESLDAIFQPFYRINGDQQGPDGNGLGLAIASEAIRLHHGTISAANLRPTGLEIAIRLPISFDAAFRRYELTQPEHNTTS